jgi:hypothetical protein
MRIADECRRRALVLRELAKESPQLYDQCAAVADARLTLAAIDDEFNPVVGHVRRSSAFH